MSNSDEVQCFDVAEALEEQANRSTGLAGHRVEMATSPNCYVALMQTRMARTVVGDQRLEWSKGDCFAVPTWEWHALEQRGGDPAILFSVHDQPVLEAFDFYREEREED